MNGISVPLVVLGLVAFIHSVFEMTEKAKKLVTFVIGVGFLVPLLGMEAGLITGNALPWVNVGLQALATILAMMGYYDVAPKAAAAVISLAKGRLPEG